MKKNQKSLLHIVQVDRGGFVPIKEFKGYVNLKKVDFYSTEKFENGEIHLIFYNKKGNILKARRKR